MNEQLLSLENGIDFLKSELQKVKFHNACLLNMLGNVIDGQKLKSPTMQEVCVLFDLSNDELKIILKNIQSFDNDLDKFSKDTLSALNKKISNDGLFFIIKGIKNSTNGKIKKTCKSLLKQHKKLSKNEYS